MNKKYPKEFTSVEKFSDVSRQAVGDGRIPKDPNVPTEKTNPKEEQDTLPTKSKKKRKS